DNAVLQIELDGTGTGAGTNGLTISAGASTVRGLAINRFIGSMILVQSSGNTVAGNFLGIDVLGTTALARAVDGAEVSGANNTIGGTDPADRNVISGNRVIGAEIRLNSATGNVVHGNFIGTNAAGTAALGGGVGRERE